MNNSFVLGIGGLPGSGKTTLISGLLEMPAFEDAAVLSSDEIRKELWGIDRLERLPQDAFTPEFSAQVYEEMNVRLEAALLQDQNVILDTLFVTPQGREINQAIAKDKGAQFIGVWLDAPVETLLDRVSKRVVDVSNAREDMVHLFSSIYDETKQDWPVIDASGSPQETRENLIAHLTNFEKLPALQVDTEMPVFTG